MRRRRECFLILVTVLMVGLATAPGAVAKCKTFKHRAKLESGVFSTDLAYLNLSQFACLQWCPGYKSVLAGDRADLHEKRIGDDPIRRRVSKAD